MDKGVFYKLTYGMYILSTEYEGRQNACIINTAMQVSASPEKISITISKNNFTTKLIEKSGVFAVSILTEGADLEFIGGFGFRSGEQCNKFEGFNILKTSNNIPYIDNNVNSVLDCEVIDSLDLGTHITFIGEVLDTKIINDEKSLTYHYYQTVIKGGTPANAPSQSI